MKRFSYEVSASESSEPDSGSDDPSLRLSSSSDSSLALDWDLTEWREFERVSSRDLVFFFSASWYACVEMCQWRQRTQRGNPGKQEQQVVVFLTLFTESGQLMPKKKLFCILLKGYNLVKTYLCICLEPKFHEYCSNQGWSENDLRASHKWRESDRRDFWCRTGQTKWGIRWFCLLSGKKISTTNLL